MRLELDFGYDDDTVINNLRECMEELKKSKLDYSGSPPSHELPQKPFGLFSPPPLAQQVALDFILVVANICIQARVGVGSH